MTLSSGMDIGHQCLGQSKFHVVSVASARIPYPTSLLLQLFSVTIEEIMKLDDKESVRKLQKQRETLIAQGIDDRYPISVPDILLLTCLVRLVFKCLE